MREKIHTATVGARIARPSERTVSVPYEMCVATGVYKIAGNGLDRSGKPHKSKKLYKPNFAPFDEGAGISARK